jgi:hypothetical protein
MLLTMDEKRLLCAFYMESLVEEKGPHQPIFSEQLGMTKEDFQISLDHLLSQCLLWKYDIFDIEAHFSTDEHVKTCYDQFFLSSFGEEMAKKFISP